MRLQTAIVNNLGKAAFSPENVAYPLIFSFPHVTAVSPVAPESHP